MDRDPLPEGSWLILATPPGEDSYRMANPFAIARELRGIVGDVLSAKATAAGALLIKTTNAEQASILLSENSLLGKPTTFRLADQLNTIEAYAYVPGLQEVSDEEIMQEMKAQGVVGVRRLRSPAGAPTPGIRFRFRGASHPAYVNAGFEKITLRTWIRTPRMCTHCAKYGHTAKSCKTKQARCLKCAGGHSTDACTATALNCPHCGGPHNGWNRKCPTLQKHLNQDQPEKTQDQRPSSKKTKTTTVEAATQTMRKHRFDASSQTKKSTTKEAAVQAAPALTNETSEEDSQSSNSHSGWWLRSRSRAQEDAELPPPSSKDQDKPELNDPELFPQPKEDAPTENLHPYIFKYADDSLPTRTITRLYRYEKSVRVVDLNLRPGSRAHRAAVNGFYFDSSFGRRLYLKRT